MIVGIAVAKFMSLDSGGLTLSACWLPPTCFHRLGKLDSERSIEMPYSSPSEAMSWVSLILHMISSDALDGLNHARRLPRYKWQSQDT